MRSDGTIFLLQRRRRNVSEVRSFLWNFQPISEEYSQPSPGSRLCRRDKDKIRLGNCTHNNLSTTESTEILMYFVLTSTATTLSDIFFLGLMSLFLRWTWYIFSAATQDLGLSSGGMVTPYSQPMPRRHIQLVRCAVFHS